MLLIITFEPWPTGHSLKRVLVSERSSVLSQQQRELSRHYGMWHEVRSAMSADVILSSLDYVDWYEFITSLWTHRRLNISTITLTSPLCGCPDGPRPRSAPATSHSRTHRSTNLYGIVPMTALSAQLQPYERNLIARMLLCFCMMSI